MKILAATLLFIMSTTTALATNVSAVDRHSCKQLKGQLTPFVLVLKKGENVPKSILQCANDAELAGATFTGLGALENTTLSYFDHKKKTYQQKKFPHFLELLALNGNITQLDGKRVTHIHVALSDENYQMLGGHLSDAFVGAVAEISVIPMSQTLVKKADTKTGLNLIVVT